MAKRTGIYKIQLKRTTKNIDQIKEMESQELKESKLAFGEPLYMDNPDYLIVGKQPSENEDGTLISKNKVIKAVDRVVSLPSSPNLWDEEVEIGSLNATTGNPSTGANYQRSVNFCKCMPNTQYYIVNTNHYNIYGIFWYTDDKTYISKTDSTSISKKVTSPFKATYFKVVINNFSYSGGVGLNYPASQTAYYGKYSNPAKPYTEQPLADNGVHFKSKEDSTNYVEIIDDEANTIYPKTRFTAVTDTNGVNVAESLSTKVKVDDGSSTKLLSVGYDNTEKAFYFDDYDEETSDMPNDLQTALNERVKLDVGSDKNNLTFGYDSATDDVYYGLKAGGSPGGSSEYPDDWEDIKDDIEYIKDLAKDLECIDEYGSVYPSYQQLNDNLEAAKNCPLYNFSFGDFEDGYMYIFPPTLNPNVDENTPPPTGGRYVFKYDPRYNHGYNTCNHPIKYDQSMTIKVHGMGSNSGDYKIMIYFANKLVNGRMELPTFEINGEQYLDTTGLYNEAEIKCCATYYYLDFDGEREWCLEYYEDWIKEYGPYIAFGFYWDETNEYYGNPNETKNFPPFSVTMASPICEQPNTQLFSLVNPYVYRFVVDKNKVMKHTSYQLGMRNTITNRNHKYLYGEGLKLNARFYRTTPDSKYIEIDEDGNDVNPPYVEYDINHCYVKDTVPNHDALDLLTEKNVNDIYKVADENKNYCWDGIAWKLMAPDLGCRLADQPNIDTNTYVLPTALSNIQSAYVTINNLQSTFTPAFPPAEGQSYAPPAQEDYDNYLIDAPIALNVLVSNTANTTASGNKHIDTIVNWLDLTFDTNYIDDNKIYGGNVDVYTGELKVTKICKDIKYLNFARPTSGDNFRSYPGWFLSESGGSSYNPHRRFLFKLTANSEYWPEDKSPWPMWNSTLNTISSYFTYVSLDPDRDDYPWGTYSISSDGYLILFDNNISGVHKFDDVTSLINWLNGQDSPDKIQLVYTLAETYEAPSITESKLYNYSGTNYVWSAGISAIDSEAENPYTYMGSEGINSRNGNVKIGVLTETGTDTYNNLTVQFNATTNYLQLENDNIIDIVDYFVSGTSNTVPMSKIEYSNGNITIENLDDETTFKYYYVDKKIKLEIGYKYKITYDITNYTVPNTSGGIPVANTLGARIAFDNYTGNNWLISSDGPYGVLHSYSTVYNVPTNNIECYATMSPKISYDRPEGETPNDFVTSVVRFFAYYGNNDNLAIDNVSTTFSNIKFERTRKKIFANTESGYADGITEEDKTDYIEVDYNLNTDVFELVDPENGIITVPQPQKPKLISYKYNTSKDIVFSSNIEKLPSYNSTTPNHLVLVKKSTTPYRQPDNGTAYMFNGYEWVEIGTYTYNEKTPGESTRIYVPIINDTSSSYSFKTLSEGKTLIKIPDNCTNFVYSATGGIIPRFTNDHKNATTAYPLAYYPNKLYRIRSYFDANTGEITSREISRMIKNARKLSRLTYPSPSELDTKHYRFNHYTRYYSSASQSHWMNNELEGIPYGGKTLGQFISYYQYLTALQHRSQVMTEKIKLNAGHQGNAWAGWVCVTYLSTLLGQFPYQGVEWWLHNFADYMKPVDRDTVFMPGDIIIMSKYKNADPNNLLYPDPGYELPALYSHGKLVSDIIYNSETGTYTGHVDPESSNIWTKESLSDSSTSSANSNNTETSWYIRLPYLGFTIQDLKYTYEFDIDKKLEILNNIQTFKRPPATTYYGDHVLCRHMYFKDPENSDYSKYRSVYDNKLMELYGYSKYDTVTSYTDSYSIKSDPQYLTAKLVKVITNADGTENYEIKGTKVFSDDKLKQSLEVTSVIPSKNLYNICRPTEMGLETRTYEIKESVAGGNKTRYMVEDVPALYRVYYSTSANDVNMTEANLPNYEYCEFQAFAMPKISLATELSIDTSENEEVEMSYHSDSENGYYTGKLKHGVLCSILGATLNDNSITVTIDSPISRIIKYTPDTTPDTTPGSTDNITVKVTYEYCPNPVTATQKIDVANDATSLEEYLPNKYVLCAFIDTNKYTSENEGSVSAFKKVNGTYIGPKVIAKSQQVTITDNITEPEITTNKYKSINKLPDNWIITVTVNNDDIILDYDTINSIYSKIENNITYSVQLNDNGQVTLKVISNDISQFGNYTVKINTYANGTYNYSNSVYTYRLNNDDGINHEHHNIVKIIDSVRHKENDKITGKLTNAESISESDAITNSNGIGHVKKDDIPYYNISNVKSKYNLYSLDGNITGNCAIGTILPDATTFSVSFNMSGLDSGKTYTYTVTPLPDGNPITPPEPISGNTTTVTIDDIPIYTDQTNTERYSNYEITIVSSNDTDNSKINKLNINNAFVIDDNIDVRIVNAEQGLISWNTSITTKIKVSFNYQHYTAIIRHTDIENIALSNYLTTQEKSLVHSVLNSTNNKVIDVVYYNNTQVGTEGDYAEISWYGPQIIRIDYDYYQNTGITIFDNKDSYLYCKTKDTYNINYYYFDGSINISDFERGKVTITPTSDTVIPAGKISIKYLYCPRRVKYEGKGSVTNESVEGIYERTDDNDVTYTAQLRHGCLVDNNGELLSVGDTTSIECTEGVTLTVRDPMRGLISWVTNSNVNYITGINYNYGDIELLLYDMGSFDKLISRTAYKEPPTLPYQSNSTLPKGKYVYKKPPHSNYIMKEITPPTVDTLDQIDYDDNEYYPWRYVLDDTTGKPIYYYKNDPENTHIQTLFFRNEYGTISIPFAKSTFNPALGTQVMGDEDNDTGIPGYVVTETSDNMSIDLEQVVPNTPLETLQLGVGYYYKQENNTNKFAPVTKVKVIVDENQEFVCDFNNSEDLDIKVGKGTVDLSTGDLIVDYGYLDSYYEGFKIPDLGNWISSSNLNPYENTPYNPDDSTTWVYPTIGDTLIYKLKTNMVYTVDTANILLEPTDDNTHTISYELFSDGYGSIVPETGYTLPNDGYIGIASDADAFPYISVDYWKQDQLNSSDSSD